MRQQSKIEENCANHRRNSTPHFSKISYIESTLIRPIKTHRPSDRLSVYVFSRLCKYPGNLCCFGHIAFFSIILKTALNRSMNKVYKEMIAAKDMKCASFPNLALSTLLALMNVLVTFNAHLSLSGTLPIDSPSFLFFTPFCPVSHCLCLIIIMQYDLHFFLYTLF